jgi:hypothetical protein
MASFFLELFEGNLRLFTHKKAYPISRKKSSLTSNPSIYLLVFTADLSYQSGHTYKNKAK